jgi:hypothetical protein
MSRNRKARTPTTEYEQSVLIAHIQRFFDAPDRSIDRAEIVQKVLAALNVDNRQWTARLIRLWFNNNRRHYLRGGTPRPIAYSQPMPPFHYGIPLNVRPPPLPLFLPPAIVPRGTAQPPIATHHEQKSEEPSINLFELPALKCPPKMISRDEK